MREVPGSNPGRAHSFWNNFEEKSDEKKSYAVTRIRTWVVAATTRSTNHYTITALDELLFWQKNKNQGGVKKIEKNTSPAGNRTPVSRVTGEDTYHYTTEDIEDR